MGRGQGNSGPPDESRRRSDDPTRALAKEVRDAWKALRAHLPEALYLAGGSALALRLSRRESHDLDFFYHEGAVDLGELEAALIPLGFAVTNRAPGTLQGLLGRTKLEFLHADEAATQHLQARPETIDGVLVASMADLMAMKLKVLAERGELRDYFDVMTIDQHGGVTLEDGIAHWMNRYGIDAADSALAHLVRSLGYLDDVDDDDAVPMPHADLARWWATRQRELIQRLGT